MKVSLEHNDSYARVQLGAGEGISLAIDDDDCSPLRGTRTITMERDAAEKLVKELGKALDGNPRPRSVLFPDWDPDRHVVPESQAMVPAAAVRFCSMKWGYVEPYDVLYWAIDPDGSIIVYDEYCGLDPNKLEGLQRQAHMVASDHYERARHQGIETLMLESAHVGSTAPNDSGRTIGRVFEDAGFRLQPVGISVATAEHQLKTWLTTAARSADHPRLRVSGGCTMLLSAIHRITRTDVNGDTKTHLVAPYRALLCGIQGILERRDLFARL